MFKNILRRGWMGGLLIMIFLFNYLPGLGLPTPVVASTVNINTLIRGADHLVTIQGPNSGTFPYNWEWMAIITMLTCKV